MEFGLNESCPQSASTCAVWQPSPSTLQKAEAANTHRVRGWRSSSDNRVLFFRWKSNSTIKPLVLLPINEIGKRTLHSLEHSSCFFLRPMEGMLDLRFDAANDSPFISLVVVGFNVFHGRAGKHPFCASDRAACRADVDRANWTGRFI